MSRLRIGPGVKVLDEQIKSIAEFESWKHSVIYILRQETDFKPYLKENVQFGAKTKDEPNRKLTADTTSSAADKCQVVDFMLATIHQYTPKIPFNDICRDCGTLEEVWQVIRLHSNINTSGALLNEVWNITRLPNESPQCLYSRIKQAYDDNLIRKNSIIYKDAPLPEDEELSPTLHCTIILHWLQILHPKLRDLVAQRFCTELRNASYAAIWPELCRTVDILLKELADDGTVCRFGDSQQFGDNSRSQQFGDNSRYQSSRSSARSRGFYPRSRGAPFQRSTQPNVSRQCDYCRVMGRQSYRNHNIDNCLFLKDERQYSARGTSRAFETDDYDEHCQDYYDECGEYSQSELKQVVTEHYINRVAVSASPVIVLYHNNTPYDITLDSGGTTNAMDSATAGQMNCDIRPTYQRAFQADGKTELDVIGETEVELSRNGQTFRYYSLVYNSAEPVILAGMPFMIENDVSIRPAKSEVVLNGTEIIKYQPNRPSKKGSNVRLLKSYTIKCPDNKSHLTR